ncbi:hypothetical protein ILUMI_23549 [Ignelater luminosus]|uniref:Reverse transcriptase domain-containing protein n=1 Tax=Ignelater luminosus TaxID=2038154 RepID=A0A8K0C8L9_IGNLU|nr:hypothetical protein ILUMI_23549 [Ignelater luminosus]
MKTNNKEKSKTLTTLEEWRKYYEIPEIQICIKEIKTGRSLGPGDILLELIKSDGRALTQRIRQLMNACMKQHKVAKGRKIGYISSLYKKGNRKDLNNYRALSLTNTLSRLWVKVLYNRLREEIGNTISEDQNGFTPGRSCIDSLFTLQQLLEKRIRKNEETHITLIDIKKAYDSVPRHRLWTALKAVGVSKHLIRTIKDIYNENKASTTSTYI